MKINKHLLIANIYFFFNSFALPLGLLYTSLLTPFFLYWIVLKKKYQILLLFLLLVLPFIIAHTIIGVEPKYYIISLLLLTSVLVFTNATYLFFKSYRKPLIIFKGVARLNLIFVIIAFLALFSSFKDLFWHTSNITGSLRLSRLALLTYEPSYYSLLLIPLFFLFLLNFIFKKNRSSLLFCSIIISLILSFSLGVILGIIISLLIFFFFYLKKMLLNKTIRRVFKTSVVFIGASLLVLLVFFPSNPLFQRIDDLFSGRDTSGKGRTVEAFYLGYKIAEQKNIWWGVGLGQVKIIGDKIIKDYYNYPANHDSKVAIPCAFAETLAIFGILGAVIRIFLPVVLFIKFKVYKNYYQFLLFSFIFVYQFTGSFIMNIAEYVIWILALVNVFPEFDTTERKIKTSVAGR